VPRDDRVHRDSRLRVAKERRAELPLKEEGRLRTTFETLEPEFSGRYGKGDHRWVNVLRFSNYSDRSIAAVLPFNTFDRTWPRLGMGGDPIPVGSEGWVFPQRYKNLGQCVSLLSAGDAIIGSLGQLGIKAELSEPGHIAKQMLDHLGGLWGVHLLADLDTLKLLNKMAGGLRRKRNEDETVEENFELRAAPLKDWTDLIAQRQAKRSLPGKSLEEFRARSRLLTIASPASGVSSPTTFRKPHCASITATGLTAWSAHSRCRTMAEARIAPFWRCECLIATVRRWTA
jgi:hypothetical protein